MKKLQYTLGLCVGLLLLNTASLQAQGTAKTENTESLLADNTVAKNSEFKYLNSNDFLTAAGIDPSLIKFEKSDHAEGLKVLEKGYEIAYVDKEIVAGSCWGFVNAVYSRIGKEYQRTTVYSTQKSDKKYADKNLLKPGDWIYHINYEYKMVEHSAIFVCWKNFEQGTAVTLSYAGQNRKQAGRFGVYNLNGVYSIFRLTKKTPTTL